MADERAAKKKRGVGRWALRYLICALGTSPISSVPYVISLAFDNVSFGLATLVINMLFIVVQILLLRREFRPIQLLQIVANIIFSAAIDVSTNLLSWLDPTFFPVQLLCVLLGCIILAVGIAVEVAPNAVVVPGEGIVRTIARVTKVRFGTVKICFDVTLALIALVLSFLFFETLRGLGLATIICAVLVGWLVNRVNDHFPLIRRIRSLAQ